MDRLEGQYQSPVRVVGFNTAEKWSEDVSADVAHERRRRSDLQTSQRVFLSAELRGSLRRPLSRHPFHFQCVWCDRVAQEGKVRHPFFKGVRKDLSTQPTRRRLCFDLSARSVQHSC
jgi:hypothetical protein